MGHSFVTVGDSNYFPSIALSAIQVEKFHPECLFGIYDWGFSKGEREFLNNRKNVRLIEWRDDFKRRPFPDSYFTSVFRVLRMRVSPQLKGKLILVMLRNLLNVIFNDRGGKEWLLAQKPYCFLHWASQHDVDEFIFLDGDAFLMSRVNELFEADFDLGVTIRRASEISFVFNACQVINSGVVVFSSKCAKNISVVQSWIDAMQRTHEYLVEQTALTRLLLGYDKTSEAEVDNFVEVKIKDKDVCVKLLDCDIYNFNWIEEGVDPAKNKIVHFKGGRHSGARFIELANSLGLEAEVEHVLQWHQS